jgi:DNA-binding MarR family transcriptional regulator
MKDTTSTRGRQFDPDRMDAVQLAKSMKLERGLGFLIRVIDTRMNLLYQNLTQQEDITPRQFGVLLTLYQRGALTLSDLANAIRVDRATLSEMINRMVDRGLIAKRGNARDRRSAEVFIAPQGESALLKIVHGAAMLQSAMLEPLPAAHRSQFLKWIRLIADADVSRDKV